MQERRLATVQEARAFAHPLRVRIVRLLHDETLTNRELAQRLDADPATTLHHVRTLVRAGFVEPLDERRGTRGARERPYRSTGKSWLLDFSGTSAPVTSAAVGAFVAELAETREDEVQLTRVALRLTRVEAAELSQRIGVLVEEYVGRSDAPGDDAESWALFVALHPRRRLQDGTRG